LKKNITDVRAKCLKSVTNKIYFKKDE